MKKTIITMMALLLALCLVGAPVFAGSVSEPTAFDPSTKKGNTNVYVDVNVSNISATVPLKMVVVANNMGGTFQAPSDTAYHIINKTAMPIKVTSIALAENTASGLTYVDVAANVTSAVDQITMQLNTVQLTKAAAVDVSANTSFQVAGATLAEINDTSSGALGGKAMPLTATGSTGLLTNTEYGATGYATEAFSITYTIAPNT